MTDKRRRILFVELNKEEASIYDKAFKRSGLRQHSEFVRMLINAFLKVKK